MKPGPKLTQFCAYGHDTFICGRGKQGFCKNCRKIINKRRHKPKIHNPFCPQGHNKDITGRTKKERCKLCALKRTKIWAQEVKTGKRIPIFIKKFCINGHDIAVVGRDNQGHCIKCSEEYAENHREETILKHKQYYADNRDIFAERWQKYAAEHEKEEKERKRKYDLENPEKRKAQTENWRKKHPAQVALSRLKSDTERALRIVSWGRKGISKIYKSKPRGMEVDHIIPLQGEGIAGLHVSWNLQYLDRRGNASKGNRINLAEVSIWYGKLLEEVGLK